MAKLNPCAKCGTCMHWMNHYECHREHYERDGRWHGPSCEEIGCGNHTPKPWLQKEADAAWNAANPQEVPHA